MFKNTDLTKTDLYAILVGIFCAGLIISNIIASKTFEFFLDNFTMWSYNFSINLYC